MADTPFIRAARFNGEADSRPIYTVVQQAIADLPPADISAFRIQVDGVWHVVAVATTPLPGDLERFIEGALDSGGERVELPSEVATALLARHREIMKHRLPWAEAHYSPGRRINT